MLTVHDTCFLLFNDALERGRTREGSDEDCFRRLAFI